MLIPKSPENGEIVPLLTEEQRNYTKERRKPVHTEAFDVINTGLSNDFDYTKPLPVHFEWSGSGGEEVLFELSDKPDFSNIVRSIKTAAGGVDVYNLLSDTEYFWRVNSGDSRKFKTENAVPRWIYIDGITNVRDAGMRLTVDKRYRVRQGLVYRGSAFNQPLHGYLTEEGIRIMKEDLGIKTEYDLRGEANLYEERTIPGTEYINIPTNWYASFFDHAHVCKQIFDIFADVNSYPIYYHCAVGADRTGTVAFLLYMILGVSMEDAITDYEYTSLSKHGERTRENEMFVGMLEWLDKYGSETDSYNDKAVAALMDRSVTRETVDRIREILLEEI